MAKWVFNGVSTENKWFLNGKWRLNVFPLCCDMDSFVTVRIVNGKTVDFK
jgi:hypothetical protein